MTDLAERLRNLADWHGPEAAALMREAADEIERLRELFRKDGEDHAARVKELVKQHETRMTRYAEEIERLRAARNDALEEAAKVAWEHDDDVGAVIADAIRALKEKTHEPG